MSAGDDALKALQDAWQIGARYRVIRDERGTRTTLASGLTLGAARTMELRETAWIKAAPEYREVMRRPLIGIELENQAEALAAYKRSLPA